VCGSASGSIDARSNILPRALDQRSVSRLCRWFGHRDYPKFCNVLSVSTSSSAEMFGSNLVDLDIKLDRTGASSSREY
jgi:hypothetical protein